MIDTSFIEACMDRVSSVTLESCYHCKKVFDSILLCIKNAGFEGVGRVIE